MNDRPRILPVKENRKETDIVRTITFQDNEGEDAGQAGQFVMVWIPGIDEVPMSLTRVGDLKAFAVHDKGEATAAMHRLNEGDRIGIRGPYGNGFRISKARKVLAVAGGTGIAPLAPLLEAGKAEYTVVVGAQTAKELLYVNRLKEVGLEPVITTDDGTGGRKGFATDATIELLQTKGFDLTITCGPEIMMRKVAEACKMIKMPCQCSTERFMKCGIGICDSCSMDRLQVCKHGPVLLGDDLIEIPEFGKWRRGASGKREPL